MHHNSFTIHNCSFGTNFYYTTILNEEFHYSAAISPPEDSDQDAEVASDPQQHHQQVEDSEDHLSGQESEVYQLNMLSFCSS